MLTEEQIRALSAEILCVLHAPIDFATRSEADVSKAIRRALQQSAADTQEGISLQIDPRWKWAAMDESDDWHGYENKPEDRDDEWILDGGEFVKLSSIFSFPKTDNWRDSLHQIINGRLVKLVDIPADGEPVWVRYTPTDEWKKRISAGKVLSGELVCYADGNTKWTSDISGTSEWRFWRRPTQEELNQ